MLNHGLLPHLPHGLSVSGAGPQKSISHTAAMSILWAARKRALSPLFIKTKLTFYLLAPSLCFPAFTSHLVSGEVTLSPASCPFTSKPLERLIHVHCTHTSLMPPNSSTVCNLASALALEWRGSSEIHQDPVIHHIPWPSLGPCCGMCFLSGNDSWPVPPLPFLTHPDWYMLESSTSCPWAPVPLYCPVDLTYSPPRLNSCLCRWRTKNTSTPISRLLRPFTWMTC